MRKVAFVSAAALFFGSIAFAQGGPPKPAPEMANVKYFEGTWSCSGDSPAGPFGPAHKTQSTLTLKPDLDGFWLAGNVSEMKTASNANPVKGMMHITYDPAAKKYVFLWVDNTGSWATEMSSGWEGDTMNWGGDQMIMGEKATAKDVFTRKGNKEFTHSFDLTMKGKTHRIVDEVCKKKT